VVFVVAGMKERKYGSVSTASVTAAFPDDLNSRLHTQMSLRLVSVFFFQTYL
jgi:hypothetical protein